jgi:transcriptional regulator with XRE-family HTH domain
MVGIGDRIAAYRRRKGISQVVLAGLIGRSESWLSQVERGQRDVDSLTVIRDLATALSISADTLIGVELPTPPASAGHAAADSVRRYVDGYSQLLTTPQTPTRTAAELLQLAESLNDAYQGARYDEALTISPDLLAAADALTRSDTEPAIPSNRRDSS